MIRRRHAPGAALDEEGWLRGARRVPSPNFDDRPDEASVRLIVVHAISLPPRDYTGDAIERLFTNRLDPEAHPYFRDVAGLRVSSHFLIRRDGALTQFVPCAARAWHAGQSSWRGRPACNDFSVGIELEGSDFDPFEPVQYVVLARLARILWRRYPCAEIVGHSDIAPGRKSDPGPCFDWSRFARALASRRG